MTNLIVLNRILLKDTKNIGMQGKNDFLIQLELAKQNYKLAVEHIETEKVDDRKFFLKHFVWSGPNRIKSDPFKKLDLKLKSDCYKWGCGHEQKQTGEMTWGCFHPRAHLNEITRTLHREILKSWTSERKNEG